MAKVRLVFSADEDSFAAYKMNWCLALRDQLEYIGNGVWHSVCCYNIQSPQDMKALRALKSFIGKIMKSAGITEYRIETEVIDYESKKFKQAVRIDGKNLDDVFRLRCISSITKSTSSTFVHYHLFPGLLHDYKEDLSHKYVAHVGDWLCEDESGLWYILSDEEYKKIL